MFKTAIIGASGYIGSHLLRKYRETFSDCIGTGFSKLSQDLIPFDLRNPDISTLRLEETHHEAVIIASAMSNVAWCETNSKEAYELNVKGTLALVEQLAERSIKTIFLSSDYVFNGDTGHYSDIALTMPTTEYGRQKAKVEQEIPNITDKYTILRLSKIYGTTWRDGTLLDALAGALIQGQKQIVATDQFFSPTYVDDVVAMTLFIQKQGINGIVNLCNNNRYSRHQIALKLAESLNVSPSLLQASFLHSIPAMESRPLDTSLKCSSCLEHLQPSLLSIDDALRSVTSNWKKHYLNTGLQ